MKKLNLIKGLWDDSHEKQTPQKFGRYAVMLLMLLTLGVGQMWGWSFNDDNFIYFHNKGGWSDSGKMLFIGKSSYSSVYTMSAVTGNSSLWVVKLSKAGWSDATYMAVAGGSSVWGSGSWGPSNRTNATHYTNTYTSGLDASNNQRYILIPASSSNNANLSLTYLGTGEPNYTITVKAKVSTDGGSTYSTTTSPGTLSASSKKFTAYNSCNSSTSLSSGTITCGYLYSTTLTAADATGYDFVGWYNSSGTRQTTEKTLTINPTANATYYAYYKEKRYNVTAAASPAAGGSVTPTSATAMGQITGGSITATPNSGYTFGGWSGGTGTFTNASSASTTFKPTATSTVTATFNETMSTVSFVASPTGKGTFQVSSSTVTSTTAGVTTTKSVTAVPATGYVFGSWSITGGATISSTSTNPTTITGKGAGAAATLTCTFNPKTYSITLDGNGGSDGSATATYNSSTLTSVTGSSRPSYDLNGYFTATSGGTKVINANGTLVASAGSYTNSSSQWIYDDDVELHAQWTYNPVTYSVTYAVGTGYTSSGSLSAANSSTSAAISSGSSIESGTGITFTASPNTGYVVEGWYTDAACTEGKHDAGNTTYSIASLSSAVTVYVKFVEKTWSVAFAAGTGGTVTTPAATPQTVGQVTGISIAATPGTGYTFNTWTITSGSGSFTSAATTNSNTFKPTAASTITASFNETMSSLSTSCHYDAGNPSYAAPTVSGSATTVGYATTRSITAATPSTGYTFAGWTLTNCTRTDGGAATATSITIRSNGDGAAATVVANYEEVLTSRWHLVGANVASKVTFPDGWNVTSTSMMQKASGHSTESVVYGEATVSNASGTYEFKVVDDNGASSDIWYGYSTGGTYLTWTGTATKTVYSGDGNANNLKFTPTVTGTYRFKVDYSGSNPAVTITYPVSYTLTYSIGSVAGNNGSISTSPTTASGSKVISGTNVTLTAPAAATGYTWKGWYTNAAGTEGKIADTDRAITVTMNADKTLYACYTENTFNVRASASPAAGGTVTPTSNTSMGQVTGGDITASPNAGYSFNGWSIASGTGYFGTSGTATTSNTANTKFRPTEAATLTGTFAEVMRTVTVAVNNNYLGSVSTTSLTSVGPATASAEVTATPVAGATFSNWTLPSGTSAASTYTSSSNPIKINATAASKTITANFSETMHTVSMSTADASKGTVGAASASVGQITAVQISATPKSGYMFSAWVKVGGSGTVTYYTGPGNGQLTDASGEEKETTYICVNGDVTLQATWEPDRSSGYVVYYGNDGVNADGESGHPEQARAWKDGKLYRPSTAESDVSYFTFTAGVGDVGKVIQFKVHKLSPSTWYGYGSASGGKIDSDISNVALNTSYGNGRMCVIMPGSYLFTWDKSTNKLSVRYPNDVYYVRGGFNSWLWNHPMTETSSGVYSATVNMTEANHTYSGDAGFKVLIAGKYYGKNSTTVTRSSSTGSAAISSCSTSGANIGITTDYTGDYTFTYTVSTNTLQVTYPTAYKITFGKGSVNGSASNCSAVNLDNGNSAVTSNSTWVKSGHRVKLTAPAAKSGYTYDGWFSNNAGTGDALTTNANCTTTVNAADITRYACYHENMTTVTFVASPAGKGSFKIGGAAASSTTAGVTTTRSVQAVAGTGYRLTGTIWTKNNANITLSDATANPVTVTGGGSGGTSTLTATFTPITYTIAFNANGGSGTMTNQTGVAYDSETAIKSNTFTRTGYTFAGWAESAGGAVVRADGAAHGNLSSTQGATVTLYAKWTAKTSALTFDYQTSATGYGSSGSISAATATYAAAMPALTGTLPTAAEGYAFMGFYDATGGGGTKYYNADGSSAHNWDKDVTSGTTLFAYYKKAEITALTFDAVAYDPEGTVGVTPTIDPTPVGDKIICWTVLRDNDTPLDPQPAITWNGTKATFTASAYSGTYKVQAVLRTGTSCGGGTELSTRTESFSVAGSHTVTVNYKCGDDVIKAATSVTATPLAWSEDITAPDIFGYTFTRWNAADGVTIKNGESTPVTTRTDATIKIKATYHGSLTAVYTQKSMIFFKNTLGWSDVYVNFYDASYWNNPKGSGNKSVTNRNKHMTRYGETDIWYYDYGAASITPTLYVSFTSASQDNSENFWKSGGVNVVYPANYPDAINTDKSSENGFKAATPMFVPLATQDKVTLNQSSGGKADYYNAGYWTMYNPGTGYTLEIYSSGGSFLKSQTFTSLDDLMPMKAVVDLEGGQTFQFQIRRGGESSAGITYGNTGTMTYANHGQGTPWDMTNTMSPSFTMARITTNAAGSYTFHLSYSGNSSTPPHYRLRMAVDYPLSSGDYRLVYSDAVQTKALTSAIVTKENNGSDIVSFFVRPGSTPVLRIQQATVNPSTGAVTWKEYPTDGTPTNQITGAIATTLTSGGTDVYNFNLSMNGSGALSIASVEKYEGNYYIRTDAANSKWDNYKSDPDHLMTYSEYSIEHGGYTHYYCHWVKSSETGRKNVKFVIANDYSPNISDTLTRETASGTWANIGSFINASGDLLRDANVRFMWDKRSNTISRAYIDGAQNVGSDNFLYMLNMDSPNKIRWDGGSALTSNKVTFTDKGNWMYEANVEAQPTARIRLLSNWGTSPIITQYFRGSSSESEELVGGSGSDWYDIRVIYDFKTNRMIAGLIPSGTIDEQLAIHADVMFIREHQGDIAQLTFAEKEGKMGAITDIETAFGVLQFNKWTINNKSKADGHAPLSPLLSKYERDLFYVSFPFRVAMEDVYGFGTYGTHWIIEEYDGAGRAANGFWKDSDPNWKFVFNRKNKFFEPGIGYIIALDLDELGESSSVWANTDQVELYFPSYGTMPNITQASRTYEIPAHECTINRPTPDGDRRIADSHWNVLGVPTYVNPDAPSFANTEWITAVGPNFLYQVNWNDNTVSAVSSSTFTYHAMHAYLVQYCDNVTWTASVSPTLAPRRNSDYRGEYEFRLEMLQNDKAVDQTYVKLSDDEHVTTGFEFNYDLSKEFNKNRANIYTLVTSILDGGATVTEVAGNTLPMTEQTTVIPVGVKIAATGDYTFAIPEGTNGVGVTLIDNETGIRTSLSALDYTINLPAGTYNERFVLEISPIQHTPTDIETISDEGLEINGARKVLIDGILYIVKDGVMYDARGNRVQ